MIAIAAGVLAILAGHMRYHQTQTQIDRGTFEPPRLTIDISALLPSAVARFAACFALLSTAG
jgi:uncharacterized membrane protein YidH (DUF202 family)